MHASKHDVHCAQSCWACAFPHVCIMPCVGYGCCGRRQGHRWRLGHLTPLYEGGRGHASGWSCSLQALPPAALNTHSPVSSCVTQPSMTLMTWMTPSGPDTACGWPAWWWWWWGGAGRLGCSRRSTSICGRHGQLHQISYDAATTVVPSLGQEGVCGGGGEAASAGRGSAAAAARHPSRCIADTLRHPPGTHHQARAL